MKRTNNPQLNTKLYWNHIYTTPARSREYWEKTYRFFMAVDRVKDGDRFIDLGCGVGIPSRMVVEKRKGCESWGVDISSEIIEANKKDYPSVKWYQGYLGNLPFLPDNYFDVAFCGEVIEHLDEPDYAFTDAQRILKPGGKFIVTTPQGDHVDSPEHVWYFQKEDIDSLYIKNGFKLPIYQEVPDMEHLYVFFAVGEKI